MKRLCWRSSYRFWRVGTITVKKRTLSFEDSWKQKIKRWVSMRISWFFWPIPTKHRKKHHRIYWTSWRKLKPKLQIYRLLMLTFSRPIFSQEPEKRRQKKSLMITKICFWGCICRWGKRRGQKKGGSASSAIWNKQLSILSKQGRISDWKN